MRGEHTPGDVVAGRYRLNGRLGTGGMGTVWRARDERLNVSVALKQLCIPSDATEDQHRERLARARREGRILSRLKPHPHIVSVRETVEADGVPWLVMNLVEGRTLARTVREDGPLPMARAAALAGQLLDALLAVHSQQVLHRDVKPDNVVITSGEHAVLVDFGIAIHVAETSLTHPDTLVGTHDFLDPERLRGQQAQTASDLFCLGSTLYFAIEGRPPFRRDNTAATFQAILAERPVPLRHAGPLAGLVHGLLAPDPAQRPTAEAAIRQLHQILADAATTTRTVSHRPLVPGSPEQPGPAAPLPAKAPDSRPKAAKAPDSPPKAVEAPRADAGRDSRRRAGRQGHTAAHQGWAAPAPRRIAVSRPSFPIAARPLRAGQTVALATAALLVTALVRFVYNEGEGSEAAPTSSSPPSLSAVAPAGKLIFSDDFSSTSGDWETLSDSKASMKVDTANRRLGLSVGLGGIVAGIPRVTTADRSWLTENVRVNMSVTVGAYFPEGASLGIYCSYAPDGYSYGVTFFTNGISVLRVRGNSRELLGNVTVPVELNKSRLRLECTRAKEKTVRVRIWDGDRLLVEGEDSSRATSKGYPLAIRADLARGYGEERFDATIADVEILRLQRSP